MIFRKTFKGGRGGLLNPKMYVADFEPFCRAFLDVFRKKLHHNFPKMRGGAAFGIFPKNHALWKPDPSLRMGDLND